MKQKSISTNFILNVLRVASTTLIGLIMIPYVNKVLGVDNIGKVEYANVIVNYFLMFSALGIPIYAIREVSKLKNNKKERSKLVLELLFILLITTVISYVILFLLMFIIPNFSNYKDLLILLSTMIFLSNIGAEWYFQGMENQKYITIRYLIVRTITLILLFILVKTKADYMWYAFILVLNVCGSNIFNLIYLAKDLNLLEIKLSDLNIVQHMKPALMIFVATISINIYLQLDVLLLGTMVGDRYVGLYAASNKLVRFVIIFVTIIGAVLLPRLSTLFVEDKDLYYVYLAKAFKIILMVSIPCSLYIFFFASEIIYYLAGPEFIEGILTVKILSPLCIIVGSAYFLGYLVLYVQNKEKIYTSAVVVSAFISVILNLFTIKIFFQNGAAFVAVLAELIAVIIMLSFSKKYIKNIKLLDKDFYKIIFVNVVLSIMIMVSTHILDRTIFNVILIVVISIIMYLLFLYALKEKTFRELIHNLMSKL